MNNKMSVKVNKVTYFVSSIKALMTKYAEALNAAISSPTSLSNVAATLDDVNIQTLVSGKQRPGYAGEGKIWVDCEFLVVPEVPGTQFTIGDLSEIAGFIKTCPVYVVEAMTATIEGGVRIHCALHLDSTKPTTIEFTHEKGDYATKISLERGFEMNFITEPGMAWAEKYDSPFVVAPEQSNANYFGELFGNNQPGCGGVWMGPDFLTVPDARKLVTGHIVTANAKELFNNIDNCLMATNSTTKELSIDIDAVLSGVNATNVTATKPNDVDLDINVQNNVQKEQPMRDVVIPLINSTATKYNIPGRTVVAILDTIYHKGVICASKGRGGVLVDSVYNDIFRALSGHATIDDLVKVIKECGAFDPSSDLILTETEMKEVYDEVVACATKLGLSIATTLDILRTDATIGYGHLGNGSPDNETIYCIYQMRDIQYKYKIDVQQLVWVLEHVMIGMVIPDVANLSYPIKARPLAKVSTPQPKETEKKPTVNVGPIKAMVILSDMSQHNHTLKVMASVLDGTCTEYLTALVVNNHANIVAKKHKVTVNDIKAIIQSRLSSWYEARAEAFKDTRVDPRPTWDDVSFEMQEKHRHFGQNHTIQVDYPVNNDRVGAILGDLTACIYPLSINFYTALGLLSNRVSSKSASDSDFDGVVTRICQKYGINPSQLLCYMATRVSQLNTIGGSMVSDGVPADEYPHGTSVPTQHHLWDSQFSFQQGHQPRTAHDLYTLQGNLTEMCATAATCGCPKK